ncbi:MAG: secretin N-terminal domain-containing protein [Burkholderiales bacterium]
MKRIISVTLALAVAFVLAACAIPPRPATLDKSIADEMNQVAASKRKPPNNSEIEQALIPPLRLELPKVDGRALEPRFDLAVSAAPAQQVFLSIVTGTRYSMLVHPEVAGSISVNLKDVTVREALDSLRDLYGFEYRIEGTRIFVQSAALQTRVFRVNYLIGQRVGRSDVRVISGSVADSMTGPGLPNAALAAQAAAQAPGGASAPGSGRVTDSSRVSTSTRSDFWKDLDDTLKMIVTAEGGRSIVTNPQAGVIVVRGMPTDLRNVESYLRAIKLSVERQVMLEAKIIEVTLSESSQAGINWAAFPTGRLQVGLLNPDTTLRNAGSLATSNLIADPINRSIAAGGSTSLISGVGGGSLFGLALQTSNFAALLQFLEGQGSAQVLSSPRIATLNNQKAVLKVGTDEFFVTNVQSGTSSSGVTTGATTSFPTLSLQPFFSGVALDITPQIDEASNVILHVHPSVSSVVQDDRRINLGSLFGGDITLPLARSTVSETDSIVKVSDGNIVAIGGLMKVDVNDRRSGLPGMQDVPFLNYILGNRARLSNKKELVILIKPTIVHGETDPADLAQVRDRVVEFGNVPRSVPSLPQR